MVWELGVIFVGFKVSWCSYIYIEYVFSLFVLGVVVLGNM